MRPRRTPSSNDVIHLPGGNEDNALHVRMGLARDYLAEDDPSITGPAIAAVFEPDEAERAAIATGANVQLVIFGTRVPPLSLAVTREQPLSRPQRATDGPAVFAELPQDLVEDLEAVLFHALATSSHVAIGPEEAHLLELELGGDRRHRLAGLSAELRRGLKALEALEA